MRNNGLSVFDPLVAQWFNRCFGQPTDIQNLAWPTIAQGEHVLMTAPTGSGKTMAAFLWAIHQLVTGHWSSGCTRVLYVSPLKALNNDIQRNLLSPLEQLQSFFQAHQRHFVDIRVLTRSGDTASTDRRQMIRRPPEILITTPESLNLLLSSRSGRSILGAIKTVIMDEIHAILASRRGTYLMSAVERLVRLSGEFQRIALSATISPLEGCAAFVGGFTLEGTRAQPHYHPRPVRIIRAPSAKRYELAVRRPAVPESPRDPNDFWSAYAKQILGHVRTNQATLIFANSRRLCEKLAYLINSVSGTENGELLAYSHHGSLSKDIRTEVERNLKQGLLKAIVATGSLELGIDIGELDEVIVIQSPWSVAEAMQRIGRAGHRVGQISRGTFLPSHVMDTVSTAILVDAIGREQIETVDFPHTPLDVLTQVILSMVAFESWHPDDLFNSIRCVASYQRLTRRHFDLVIDLLQGRYGGNRIRDLQAKIAFDRMDQRISARKGALLTLYTSGGVIPDRGYYSLRHDQSGSKIGELDEEFVWEARVGQVFTLGSQNWRIRRITHSEVRVMPAARGKPALPFWRAEENSRSYHLSRKIGEFLETADSRLHDPQLSAELVRAYAMDGVTAGILIRELAEQRRHTGCSLPHRHHLVLEDIALGAGKKAGRQLIWHTLWGAAVNRPLAVAMEAAWEQRFGSTPQFFAGNDGIACMVDEDLEVPEITALVTPQTLETLLHRKLTQTGYFGARFRECAARALLLPRNSFKQRMPLWLTRLRAQKLMSAVAHYPDFPITIETWRTCLQDEFDLPTLVGLLEELAGGQITCTHIRTPLPSLLARTSGWQQVNVHMYQGDQSALKYPAADLLSEVNSGPGTRLQLDPGLVQGFEQKRQRLSAGYAPGSATELLEWVKERVALPQNEWLALLQAVNRDYGLSSEILLEPLQDKLVSVAVWPDKPGLMTARETLPYLLQGLFRNIDPLPACALLSGKALDLDETQKRPPPSALRSVEVAENQLSQWLSYYGPLGRLAIIGKIGLPLENLNSLLEALAETKTVISGELITGGAADDLCDRENYEILLRLSRRQAAPVFEALDIRLLPLFLAHYQGIAEKGASNDLTRRLHQLLGWFAPAALWESDILPARLRDYQPQWLDALFADGELLWIGAAGRKTSFCYEDELDLLANPPLENDEKQETPQSSAKDASAGLFPYEFGRFPFNALQQANALDPAALYDRLWQGVWQGIVSNDTFAALRRAIETGFKPYGMATTPVRGRPRRSGGRMAGLTLRTAERRPNIAVGNWFRMNAPESADNLLDREELTKERVRLLLDRYGIIFRELLMREIPVLRWAEVFRSLRLMELSGEVLGGYFFSDLPGLQFIAPATLHILNRALPEDAIYWFNATDPASLCGTGLEALRGIWPKRLPGTHMVCHGRQLVIVSHQHARRLEISVPADHPLLTKYLAFLEHLLTRSVSPLRSITVEAINGQPASQQHAYVHVLKGLFETNEDFKSLTLFRRH